MDTYADAMGETGGALHDPFAHFTNVECRAWIGALLAFLARPVQRTVAIEPVRMPSLDELVSAASSSATGVPVATLAARRAPRPAPRP
jgi:hypothetical protein